MKKYLIIILSFLILTFITISPSHAFWWMIYHKPEFKGKVIDAETKEPIDGAVVVAIYKEDPIISGPGGGSASVINVRETLTDKNGEFYIPSYTTIINPNAMESDVDFIIFKPSYGSFPDWRVSPSKGTEVDFEDFFSKDYGVEKEVLWNEPWKVGAESKKIKVTFGIVELPKLKTREERLKATPSHLTDESKTPILNRLIDEEDHNLGLK